MFGVKQKRLVKSLAQMAAKCCSYIGDRCDCKFIDDSLPEDRIMTHGERGNGCPELMVLAHMIAAMSEQEFNAISQRAGISITGDPAESIDAASILKEARQVRKQELMGIEPPPPKKKSIKTKTQVWTKKSSPIDKKKSAYDLSRSKKAIIAMMPKPAPKRPTSPPDFVPRKRFTYDCESCGASYGREDNLAFHQCPKK